AIAQEMADELGTDEAKVAIADEAQAFRRLRQEPVSGDRVHQPVDARLVDGPSGAVGRGLDPDDIHCGKAAHAATMSIDRGSSIGAFGSGAVGSGDVSIAARTIAVSSPDR